MFIDRFVGSCLALATVSLVSAAPAGSLDFQRDIRPILSENCFQCHGPDASTRMVNLRLDLREEAVAERKTGRAIVPKDPNASLIWQRINHDKEAMRMPPASSHKKLTAAQKETLRRWIEQGADWKEHWSFVAPKRPPLPALKTNGWARNPIDHFILAKLEATGLEPAPEADRRALMRRVSLDLTGLPPAPADVEAFVKDKAPDAYDALVERLLASPHWGEHRGRYWLDAARYADTHGLHIDNYREMWPYRDWVISAFNRNLRFDRFTIEQIAGDMLPNRTQDQLIASGFNRCNITTNEGGAIPEEVDAIYQKDRVETTSTVWLGLTLGCAVCHDHKFDPLKQKEFYQFVAFFKNTTQQPLDGNVSDTPPLMVIPRDEDQQLWQQAYRREIDLSQRIERRRRNAEADFKTWLAGDSRRSITPVNDKRALVSDYSANPPEQLPKGITAGPGITEQDRALYFGPKASIDLGDAPRLAADKPFTIAAWIYLAKGTDSFLVASRLENGAPDPKYDDDQAIRLHGWSLEINGRSPSFNLYGDNSRDRLTVAGTPDERLQPGNWYHVAVTYDGGREQGGLTLYVNGKPLGSPVRGGLGKRIDGDLSQKPPLTLGSDGKRFSPNTALQEFRVYPQSLIPGEIEVLATWPRARRALAKSADQVSKEELDDLYVVYLNRVDPEYRDAVASLAHVERDRRAVRRRGVISLVMQEKAHSQPMARILYRGQYDQPRDEVEPGVPSVLPPMAAELPRNRLGLAYWLVDPGNPLTARVTVNRFWQEVFGTGLVKTSEDFGTMGEQPSHPELLDWLAVEFRESGWDVKKLFRMVVTSATYRQAAVATPDKIAKDPDNRLLSRGPRFRMDGELIRDYALAASGLLVRKIGGPSVKPYQPDRIWETVAMKSSTTRFYKPDSGDKLYRRSLYTFWKRSAPPASMEIFNAPSRENCTVRRERTNTPLQALVTMNDPQFVEAARSLAERAIKQGGTSVDGRLDFITENVLARPFDKEERQVALAGYRDFLEHYTARPEDGKRLIETGDSEPDRTIPPPQFAAWTMIASQVLNLDEAVNK
jgi:uncharacterized protein DUF1553/uncharacterized protein DUF1549/concanavalin A-like lectin/glucanase superfamily protein/cytochrome c